MKRTLLALLCALAACGLARADVPRTIAFQGTLKDVNGTPITAQRTVTFTLYDALTGGTAVWAETKAITPGANGLFATTLGDIAPLTSITWDKPYWVGLAIGGDAEMAPRYALSGVPYAFALPGLTAKPDGKVGIGTTDPSGPLHVKGDAAIMNVEGSTHAYIQWYPKSIASGRKAWIGFGGSDTSDFGITNEMGGRIVFGSTGLVSGGGLYVHDGSTFQTSLGIGGDGSATNAVLDVFHGSEQEGLRIRATSGSKYSPIAVVDENGNSTFQVHESGRVYMGPAQAQTLTLTSSRRYKQNIHPITGSLDTISRLQGVAYDWDAQHGGGHDIGFIAEDFGQVLPSLVAWEDNGLDAKGIDYAHLAALLTEGIKELQREIVDLKADNAVKDALVQDLTARLDRIEKGVQVTR